MADSGIITVTTAGTAVQGPDVQGMEFLIKAHPSNTGLGYAGYVAGDVADTNGFVLSAGDVMVADRPNLNMLYFDTAVSGEKFCWFKVR